MTFTDYVLDIALIGIVLLQIRGRKLSLMTFLLPLAIVGWAASEYLKGIPTTGNDLVLIAGCTVVGAVLGGLCGLFTSVQRNSSGAVIAKAGAAAAILWVVGMGVRLAFQLYATHGGSPAIGRFSVAHHITGGEAWTAAILLMAIAEALFRSAAITWRWYLVRTEAPQLAASAGAANMGFSDSTV
jgi:hypothetical protein